ncbi:MAG TPA: class I SAM-dependent methyltransferase [Thermoanaerobaculaceae bacterium]|nr:class I SAM-dependent methyltransferase [Thermoanaerobaculaceae bacterium]
MFRGIPVMLRPDIPETHWVTSRSLGIASGSIELDEEEFVPVGADGICSFVQKGVGATSGRLFRPLMGRLRGYPIPRLPFSVERGGLFLDVGSNWGRWVVAAHREGFKCVALDPSLEALLAAQEVFTATGVQACLVAGDARYLPITSGSFDVVFSYSVLQHFAKDQARVALVEMGRVLADGGQAWVQMPNAFGLRCLWRQMRRGFRGARNFEVRYWRPRELLDAFRQAFGSSSFEVDGYLGLGVGAAEASLSELRFRDRLVVRTSRAMRRLSRRLPPLVMLADSLYVRGSKVRPPGDP